MQARLRANPPWGGPGEDLEAQRRRYGGSVGDLARLFPRLGPLGASTMPPLSAWRGGSGCAAHPGPHRGSPVLVRPADGVLLSGDHVLPTITPHINGISRQPDPLAQFLASLERVGALTGVRLVLPAHGHPFTDLAGRAATIQQHHEDRLERLRKASIELARPATVHESPVTCSRRARQGMMADSETYAHLEHLRLGGQATRWRRRPVPVP